MRHLTGKPDRVPYVKKGAAFGVYRSEDLVSTIDKILSQKNIYNTKRKHVKKFLYNVAYKLDGRASMRIAQEIEELMKRKV